MVHDFDSMKLTGAEGPAINSRQVNVAQTGYSNQSSFISASNQSVSKTKKKAFKIYGHNDPAAAFNTLQANLLKK